LSQLKPLSLHDRAARGAQDSSECTQSTARCHCPQVRQIDKYLRTFCFDRFTRLTMMKEVRRCATSLEHLGKGSGRKSVFREQLTRCASEPRLPSARDFALPRQLTA
jgi:hypothetical protein